VSRDKKATNVFRGGEEEEGHREAALGLAANDLLVN
jgi:hypothetical protein